MLSSNCKRSETFSFSYRIELPPNGQIIYLLDVRTPIITATGRLIGYDGVFIDITRQAIAEHRVSNSIWREGLATLTNSLVHDFSQFRGRNLFDIGTIPWDDGERMTLWQMVWGKFNTMQAQKLVRRIIDLPREKPASRAIHDLRLLLKDQMDLVEIIIPRC